MNNHTPLSKVERDELRQKVDADLPLNKHVGIFVVQTDNLRRLLDDLDAAYATIQLLLTEVQYAPHRDDAERTHCTKCRAQNIAESLLRKAGVLDA